MLKEKSTRDDLIIRNLSKIRFVFLSSHRAFWYLGKLLSCKQDRQCLDDFQLFFLVVGFRLRGNASYCSL